MLYSPYHAFNLRRNPFGELTREERGELAIVDDLTSVETCLKSPRAVIQFVGECGYGKTSRLLALQHRFPSIEYIYLPEFGRKPRVPKSRPLIIDEAQRLPWWTWLRVLSGDGPLLVGTHVDFEARFRRRGFSVTSINVRELIDAVMIERVLERRITASVIDPNKDSLTISPLLASQLGRRFQYNLRAIESYLYDETQRTIRGEASWPPAM